MNEGLRYQESGKTNIGACNAAQRTSAASEIVDSLDRLVGLSEKMLSITAEKMNGLFINCPTCEQTKDKDVRQYPPLFTEMRARIDRTEANIHAVIDIISRCDV